MAQEKSADQVRQEHLQVMGTNLGSVYNALWNDVTCLHAKWQQYRQLYAASAEHVDLLNASASFLFRVLQDVLWEDMVLHIARLTDPPQSVRKDNLTLLRLPSLISDPTLSQELQDAVNEVKAESAFARDWRNRRLAHRDFALALESGAQPLPGISRANVEATLTAIRVAMNKLNEKYFGSSIAFELFQAQGDAQALIYCLRIARAAEERRMKRFRQGSPSPEDFEEPGGTPGSGCQ